MKEKQRLSPCALGRREGEPAAADVVRTVGVVIAVATVVVGEGWANALKMLKIVDQMRPATEIYQ
jgi:hypothetical protein